MSSSNNRLLNQLVRSRFRPKKDVNRLVKVIQLEKQQLRPRRAAVKGVYKGYFYHIPVPPQKPILPSMPKLPASGESPIPFKPVEHTLQYSQTLRQQQLALPTHLQTAQMLFSDFVKRMTEWWKSNWTIMLLNFGSICTLTGFTRSDVLELRCCSVTGSLFAFMYQTTLRPAKFFALLWPVMFASVNSFKIFNILRERESTVHLTEDQEDIYVEHFLPHGVTPKQFERLYQKATVREFPKGSALLRQGTKLDEVMLVLQGTTRANVSGRPLQAVAIGNSVDNQVEGATKGSVWLGEMQFLEKYWIHEQLKVQSKKRRNAANEAKNDLKKQQEDSTSDKEDKRITEVRRPLKLPEASSPPVKLEPSTYTIRAMDDVAVLANEDRQKLKQAKEVYLESRRPVNLKKVGGPPPEAKLGNALYNITAVDDCVVLAWSNDDLQELMERSTEMRAALTRAMSSAVVGKVINFTVHQAQARRTWGQWLDEWRNSDGATIEVRGDEGTTSDTATATSGAIILPQLAK